MKIISLSEIPFVLLLGVMKTIIVVSWRILGEDINDPPTETNHVYSQSVSQSVTGVACETINISWKHYTITIYYLQYYPRRNNQSSIIFLTLTLSGNVCLGSDIYFSLYLSFLPLFDTITILWTI